ncbi:hypothetical protein ANN_02541 [Periplaneta americana]|uniref:DUF4817 domain-containing protein n=1 Tax=Periplaneta americana TaxID=6978 RepID=A0ABQ8TYC9_PERAM|nr:hypothetical protein ANN_02541 [Periplaneta americana]
MYSNQELAEIHFMYGKADGNAALARRLYQERYPQRQCPDRKTFVRLHYRLCEYGKFNSPGLGRGRPRSTTPEVQEEILEAVNMTSFYQHMKGSVASQCSSYDCLETVERVSISNTFVVILELHEWKENFAAFISKWNYESSSENILTRYNSSKVKLWEIAAFQRAEVMDECRLAVCEALAVTNFGESSPTQNIEQQEQHFPI